MAKKILVQNKKAKFDYEITERLEAGIVLVGAEVKSVKNKNASLAGSFVTIRNDEAWLLNMHIGAYKQANLKGYNPTRKRKLLLRKKEINFLLGKLKTKGLVIFPLSLYLKNNLIKAEIAVGRVRKKYDKRELLKKREAERKIQRAIKETR